MAKFTFNLPASPGNFYGYSESTGKSFLEVGDFIRFDAILDRNKSFDKFKKHLDEWYEYNIAYGSETGDNFLVIYEITNIIKGSTKTV